MQLTRSKPVSEARFAPSIQGNSAMDPTPDEAAQLQTIGDVFTWAGLVSSEMEAGTTLSGSLAAVLGVKPGTKPRVLGVSSCSDFENVLQSWRIRVGDHDRAPTIAEWGMARLVGRACRTVAGATELEALKAQLAQAQAAAPQTVPPAAAGSLSSTATRRIKMSAIISQVDESEVFMMEEKKVIKCYARYEAVFGAGELQSRSPALHTCFLRASRPTQTSASSGLSVTGS